MRRCRLPSLVAVFSVPQRGALSVATAGFALKLAPERSSGRNAGGAGIGVLSSPHSLARCPSAAARPRRGAGIRSGAPCAAMAPKAMKSKAKAKAAQAKPAAKGTGGAQGSKGKKGFDRRGFI